MSRTVGKGVSMTKHQKDKQFRPFNLRGDKWFYLSTGRGIHGCSFHDGTTNQHVHGIPVNQVLLALEETGILSLWDRKQRVLRKPKP